MFKKTLILASLTTFVMSGCVFAAPQEPDFGPPPPAGKEMSCPFKKPPMCMKHKKPDCTCKNKCDKKDPRAEFENRLKLTDEQKAKAKEIRLNGHKEMKPIMEKLKAKHQEAESIRNSKLDESAKQEKLAKVRLDIKDLRSQAREIQKKNMQEFESILTDKQKKEIEKMKKEGKKRYYKNRKKPSHPKFAK